MKCERCGHDPDRISRLEAELVEINVKVKEAEIEFERTKKIVDATTGMDADSPKNKKIQKNLIKERLASEMDALRLRVEMIQKISPQSAIILNKKLNEYEKSHLDFLSITDEVKDTKLKDMTLVQALGLVISLMDITQNVAEIVKVCSYVIRDTLKRIKG